MKKALLEEHVRYGEARFRDKELVRPFVNRIYQDLAELEEAMKPKTCEGCKHFERLTQDGILECNKFKNIWCTDGFEYDFCCNRFETKDNA